MLYLWIAWLLVGLAVFFVALSQMKEQERDTWSANSLTFQVLLVATMVLWPVFLVKLLVDKRRIDSKGNNRS